MTAGTANALGIDVACAILRAGTRFQVMHKRKQIDGRQKQAADVYRHAFETLGGRVGGAIPAGSAGILCRQNPPHQFWNSGRLVSPVKNHTWSGRNAPLNKPRVSAGAGAAGSTLGARCALFRPKCWRATAGAPRPPCVNAAATSSWQFLGTSFGACSVALKGVRPGSRARPPSLCAQPAHVGWWARAVAAQPMPSNSYAPAPRKTRSVEGRVAHAASHAVHYSERTNGEAPAALTTLHGFPARLRGTNRHFLSGGARGVRVLLHHATLTG
jgi:hypothetical protein